MVIQIQKKVEDIHYIEYICGKCGTVNELSIDDEIVCNVCYFRVLFKKRTLGINKIKAI